jgi:hypothetical protein
MKASTRNLLVWVAAAGILAAVWYFGARPRLHFTDPAGFLVLIVAAAAALTGLLCWELATGDEDDDRPPGRGGPTSPATGEGS